MLIMVVCVTGCRLEDFENSCAAYEKALQHGEDYLTYLNYAITLYVNDEVERSREQFARFSTTYNQLVDTSDMDTDVMLQAGLLRKALTNA